MHGLDDLIGRIVAQRIQLDARVHDSSTRVVEGHPPDHLRRLLVPARSRLWESLFNPAGGDGLLLFNLLLGEQSRIAREAFLSSPLVEVQTHFTGLVVPLAWASCAGVSLSVVLCLLDESILEGAVVASLASLDDVPELLVDEAVDLVLQVLVLGLAFTIARTILDVHEVLGDGCPVLVLRRGERVVRL